MRISSGFSVESSVGLGSSTTSTGGDAASSAGATPSTAGSDMASRAVKTRRSEKMNPACSFGPLPHPSLMNRMSSAFGQRIPLAGCVDWRGLFWIPTKWVHGHRA